MDKIPSKVASISSTVHFSENAMLSAYFSIQNLWEMHKALSILLRPCIASEKAKFTSFNAKSTFMWKSLVVIVLVDL